MSKKATKTRSIAKAPAHSDLESLLPTPYPIAGMSITALQIFHNPERKPDDFDGPWNAEADKIGWCDEETGLRCIILRQKNGTLSGYVGVSPEHPLFGYEKDALSSDLATSVHGGITYSKACEENRFSSVRGEPRSERYSVCHVTRIRIVTPIETVQDTEDQFPEEEVWWFGFDTNHHYDLIPMHAHGRKRGVVYRDQAYVYAQCMAFARKLKVIDDSGRECSSAGEVPLPRLTSSAADDRENGK